MKSIQESKWTVQSFILFIDNAFDIEAWKEKYTMNIQG